MTASSFLRINRRAQWGILGLILLIGVFVRVYHFSDWLHFEIDQSYDTRLVSPAVQNNIGDLPLLGPTAGGGRSLRLGPAFYYIEYISAKVFGDTPVGHAMIVLILSLFSMPLFYVLCRRYFSITLALGLTALFSFSLYLVLYSRFSWSPNLLPFLMMAMLYALLRSVDTEEKPRDVWFITAAALIAILTQIHFNAFFIVPPVAILFLLIKRARFGWKTWLLAVGIAGVVYMPVILSDIRMNGENLGYFLNRVSGAGKSHPNTIQKIVQISQYFASNFFLIDTGIDKINGKKLTGYGLQSAPIVPWRLGAVALLAVYLAILVRNIFCETERKRKDFLLLMGIWFAVSFLYFLFISKSGFNIYPRFFLIVAPLALILLGFLLETLSPKKNRLRFALFSGVIMALCFSNGLKVRQYFSQLALENGFTSVMTEDVLPNTARATLAQQEAVAEYMMEKHTMNGYPIYLEAKHEYESVFWYHLEKKGMRFRASLRSLPVYREANYFLVSFVGKTLKGDLTQRFSVIETVDFGVFSVHTLKPNPDVAIEDRQTVPDEITTQSMQLSRLFTWNQWFDGLSDRNDDAAFDTSLEEAQQNEIKEDVNAGLTDPEDASLGDNPSEILDQLE